MVYPGRRNGTYRDKIKTPVTGFPVPARVVSGLLPILASLNLKLIIMEFKFYGHACFSVTLADGKVLLFDPFITGNPLAGSVDADAIRADYILVSHGHGDHTGDLMAIAKRTGALVISNAEITDWVKEEGYENVHPMNFGSRQFDFGMVHYVPATHSSSLPDGSYGGNPGGFIVETGEKTFYYTGDTSLTMEMQLVPYYARVDVAIMPVGGNFTMDYKQAVIASDFIKCNKVIGVHFDTFGYIVIDQKAAVQAFKEKNKELILPEIGQSILL
mgnify:CR=1 FL=1